MKRTEAEFFEIRTQRIISGPLEDEVTEAWKWCIMMYFVIDTVHHILLIQECSNQEGELGWACLNNAGIRNAYDDSKT
jgi:hypothetical protein